MQADSSAAALPALIEASSITVRRGEVPVLDHVDLTLSAGEIVCIIGPNGSGKTTLLRALLGLIAVQDGSVTRRPSLRIGYMPQRLAIDPTLPITLERFLGLSRNGNAAARRITGQLVPVVATADRAPCTVTAPYRPVTVLFSLLFIQPCQTARFRLRNVVLPYV